jgi:hypothetical protein
LRATPSSRRLLALAALVAAFGLGTACALSVLKFRSAAEAAAHTRMGVPVEAVREALQAALGLGLPLASASAVPELLAREKATDPAVREIVVFDTEGRVQFSTQPGRVGQAAPRPWQQATQRSSPSGWKWRDPDAAQAVAGAPLSNAFDLVQGQVAVSYALDDEAAAVRALAHRLARHAAAAWLGTVLLVGASLGARWVLGRRASVRPTP